MNSQTPDQTEQSTNPADILPDIGTAAPPVDTRPTAHPRNFGSDNWAGVHPEVITAIAEANVGHTPGYGGDPWTQRCEMAPQVWESQCATCGGTGFAGPSRSSSRGRRGRTGAGRHRPSAFAAVCPACLGVGWHRLSSDRVGPEPAPDGTLANPNKTLARPAGTTDRAGPFPFAPRQLKPFRGTAQESLRPSVGDRVNHVEDELTP